MSPLEAAIARKVTFWIRMTNQSSRTTWRSTTKQNGRHKYMEQFHSLHSLQFTNTYGTYLKCVR